MFFHYRFFSINCRESKDNLQAVWRWSCNFLPGQIKSFTPWTFCKSHSIDGIANKRFCLILQPDSDEVDDILHDTLIMTFVNFTD